MKNKKYYRKKITVNKEGNFVWAYIFKSLDDMCLFYKKIAPYDTGHDLVGGVCINREMFKAKSVKEMLFKNKSKQSGIVLTSVKHVRSSVVCHELMHAIFFAHGVSKVKFKKQYPITIKSMDEEEVYLYAFTKATNQYYDWYWKLKDSGKIE